MTTAAGGRGQVLVYFATLMPAVLLPVAALAAETALVAERQARLSEATVEAATAACLELDTGALRAGTGWLVDGAAAHAAAGRALAAEDPVAVLDSVDVVGSQVTVAAHEPVELRLAVFARGRSLTVHARAAARLTPGYSGPG